MDEGINKITEFSPREVPIFQALIRPSLLLGAERKLTVLLLPICFGLIFIGLNKISIVSSFLIWGIVMYLLRLIAKKDPQMSEVYFRSIKYRQYYKPQSTPFCEYSYKSGERK